jgi:hypothetical protein
VDAPRKTRKKSMRNPYERLQDELGDPVAAAAFMAHHQPMMNYQGASHSFFAFLNL